MRRKLLTALLISCIAVSGFAHRCNLCNPCKPCNCRCEPCEFTPPCAPQICGYNAPKYIDLKCPCDVFATASYLYWQAKEEGLDLGEIQTTFTNNNIESSIIKMDFDYKSAFKIGLGLYFNCDNWELYSEYTWYHHSFKNDVCAKTGTDILESVIIPVWNTINDLNISEFSDDNVLFGKWELSFDKLDIEVARPYFVGKCLTIRSGYGLRGLWITQKLNVNSSGNLTGSGITEQTLNTSQKISSWAVGPKFSMNTNWYFCNNLRLFGNFDIALLYTSYDRTNNATLENQLDSININSNIKNDNPCYLRPQTALAIGLGWGDYFDCNQWYLDLQLAYETQIYWSENMFTKSIGTSGGFINQTIPGNLNLHGLTIRVRLDF